MTQKDVADTSSDTASGSANDSDHASGSSGSHWQRHCTELVSFCWRTCKHLRCTTQQRRVTVSVIFMSLAAVAFVAVTSSIVSSIASSQFNAPLFTVNIATLPTVFLYPLHIAYRYFLNRGKLSVRDAFRSGFLTYKLGTPLDTYVNDWAPPVSGCPVIDSYAPFFSRSAE